MKRIALIHPRYGLETVGSAESYTRMLAEHLANRYEVDVLTTKALDATTWKNWYARDVETIRGVKVRRFPIEQMRAEDFETYAESYLQELQQGRKSLRKEQTWFEKQGPYVPSYIRYLREHRHDYDVFLFVTYANYLTVMGLPEVAKRSILIPAAQDDVFLQFLTTEMLFLKPKAFVFLSDPERVLVRRKFPKTEPIPCEVMGTGINTPRETDTQQFHKQYGITSPYLCYVGKVDESKDCPMLMRYFMEYKKRHDNPLQLVLIGNVVCSIPRHPDILPLGFVPDEVKYAGIAGAKALVVPAHQENMSLSLLEAMSLSVPVIVNSTCDVSRNHCIRSNGGLYYQNYFEFEGAVEYLLHHPVEYMQLCANARNYITEYYDWDVILQKFDRLIQAGGKKHLHNF